MKVAIVGVHDPEAYRGIGNHVEDLVRGMIEELPSRTSIVGQGGDDGVGKWVRIYAVDRKMQLVEHPAPAVRGEFDTKNYAEQYRLLTQGADRFFYIATDTLSPDPELLRLLRLQHIPHIVVWLNTGGEGDLIKKIDTVDAFPEEEKNGHAGGKALSERTNDRPTTVGKTRLKRNPKSRVRPKAASAVRTSVQAVARAATKGHGSKQRPKSNGVSTRTPNPVRPRGTSGISRQTNGKSGKTGVIKLKRKR